MDPLFDDELSLGWAYLCLERLLGRALEEWLIQVLERKDREQAANSRTQASCGSRPAAVVKEERQRTEEEEEEECARIIEQHITGCDGRVGGLDSTEISEEEAVEDSNIEVSEADEEDSENDKEVTIQYDKADDLGYYADSEDTNRIFAKGTGMVEAGRQGTKAHGGSRGAPQFVKGEEDLDPEAQTQVGKTTKARRKRSWRDLETGSGCHEDPRDHESKMATKRIRRMADTYL